MRPGQHRAAFRSIYDQFNITFIISAATRSAAFQVADTRVTRASDGALVDDLFVKTIVLNCTDAKLVISFTGLGAVTGVRTDKWVAAKLVRFQAWKKCFQETMNYLRDELTTVCSRDRNLGAFGLELAVIGLGISPDGTQQPAIATITNRSEPDPVKKDQLRDVNPAGQPFQRYILVPPPNEPDALRDFIGVYGCLDRRSLQSVKGMRKRIQRDFRRLPHGGDPIPILASMVAMLRLHRKDTRFTRFIGEYCVAVAVKGDYGIVAVSFGLKGQKLLVPTIIRAPP